MKNVISLILTLAPGFATCEKVCAYFPNYPSIQEKNETM